MKGVILQGKVLGYWDNSEFIQKVTPRISDINEPVTVEKELLYYTGYSMVHIENSNHQHIFPYFGSPHFDFINPSKDVRHMLHYVSSAGDMFGAIQRTKQGNICKTDYIVGMKDQYYVFDNDDGLPFNQVLAVLPNECLDAVVRELLGILDASQNKK